ncbi:beta-N-acetylglucosaminidase domain-containing protein [Aeromonas sp. FDAARGOS 1403]|uniref:beta-N-acetylglucosaminidase domain-containing protein n=1 Tax=Aeromonas TaxID=642 RepID=UPI001C2316CE|nr:MULTISPECIES: beta-N-acetylglucosaminidase domain-containing protein [Aeromonas]MCR6737444.1 protein O-GlcNAcase [Aeromonas dhakensis]QXA13803.1 beta-N-acetylglucosaminidase domain-containing protein [Aeromonas sp. FDAARGOS 1403]
MPYQTLLSGLQPPSPNLGVIEGFFGKGWSWEARARYAQWLPRHGYGFYLYAPKEDGYLRKHWAKPWPAAQLEALRQLARQCRDNGLAFGVGLSPMGAHHDYARQRPALLEKVRLIEEELKPDILAILFDDMKGDTPDLAHWQLTITHDIAAHTSAGRLLFCPSYYSTDPVLEKVFGAMPPHYLQDLGQGLDRRIDIFWTGPKVCSSEYPAAHLRQAAEWLHRKPFLWDNYPVNDGSKASSFLHLRAFENRPAELADLVNGHAVNPMKQAALSALPLATLPMSYRLGKQYDPDKALHASLNATCGPQISAMIQADLPLFQDIGLAQLTPEQVTHLKARYLPFRDQSCVDEILRWLDGEYVFDPDCLTD